jgi:hypothetical protein
MIPAVAQVRRTTSIQLAMFLGLRFVGRASYQQDGNCSTIVRRFEQGTTLAFVDSNKRGSISDAKGTCCPAAAERAEFAAFAFKHLIGNG